MARSAGFMIVVLTAGVAAGALDIVAAILQNPQLTAQAVLQSVASGWLGPAAFAGGWPTAALGLASHFGLTLGIAGVYVLLSRAVPALRRRWLLSGLGWGGLVWLAMSYVLVPLSAAPFAVADNLPAILKGLATHLICVGLPIAWITHRLSGPPRV